MYSGRQAGRIVLQYWGENVCYVSVHMLVRGSPDLAGGQLPS